MNKDNDLLNTALLEWRSKADALSPTMRYIVAITALASANKPHMIPLVYDKCKEELSETELIDLVHMARESFVKMISTMGAPKVINGMAALMNSVSDSVKEKLPQELLRPRNESDYDYVRQRGLELWKKLYSRQADKLEVKLATLCPDLSEIIQTDLYGRLLSNTKVLNLKNTELCTIGSLVPMEVPLQLKSHMLGAHRFGATDEEIQAAKFVAENCCKLS